MVPPVRERRPLVGTAAHRAAGGSLPSAFTGADTGLAALRTVSATPVYGSRRTLGFPPRRDHLGTGGPSRRPPSAGCADRRSAFPCLCVAPPGGMGAMRHVQRPRGALWDTVSAPRYEKSDLAVVAARFVFRYCPLIVPGGPGEDVREVGGQQIAPAHQFERDLGHSSQIVVPVAVPLLDGTPRIAGLLASARVRGKAK